MKYLAFSLFCLLSAFGAVSPASASVLFQSIPDLTVNPASNAWCSTCGGSYEAYDAFSFGQQANVSQIQLTVQTNWGAFPNADITVAIFSSNGSQAETQLFSQTFASGSFANITNTPHNTSIVTLDPTGLSLAAGNYWISWYNVNNLADPGYLGGSGQGYQSAALGSVTPISGNLTGTSPRQSLGFALDGPVSGVPEPATWAMFLIGFGGIGFILRRSRRNRAAPAV